MSEKRLNPIQSKVGPPENPVPARHGSLLKNECRVLFIRIFIWHEWNRESLVKAALSASRRLSLLFFFVEHYYDSTGTLVYGHYGSSRDFELLEKYGVPLNGSIALVRYGPLHPSKVVSAARVYNFNKSSNSFSLWNLNDFTEGKEVNFGACFDFFDWISKKRF